jgi:hypothetical protein
VAVLFSSLISYRAFPVCFSGISEWFSEGPNCPCYCWYHFCYYTPHLLYFCRNVLILYYIILYYIITTIILYYYYYYIILLLLLYYYYYYIEFSFWLFSLFVS